MTVVPMEERHLAALAEIEKACFHAPWSADMLREELGKGIFLVAEQDGAAVGYVGCQTVLDEGYNFAESLVCAVGAGVGFMVAMVLFSGVRKRLEDAQPPKCFEGLPITLVAASVTSLSFMGFGGVIENIFAGH